MSARLLLFAIIILAALLRLWKIDTYPAGFTPDEASFGYDAYSILKTGKDQWGQSFPIAFRSFGDFKAPLYTYLTIPSVAIFGLNELAVRLPNALLGILGVLVVYFLTKELISRVNSPYTIRYAPLLSALLFAISPWHVSLSRGAFEANLTTFLMPLGVLAFLRGLKDSRWMMIAAVAFGFNLLSYHSARLITPLLVLILLFFNRRYFTPLHKSITRYMWSVTLFLIFLIITVYSVFFGSGTRAGDIGIFNPTGGWGVVADRRYEAVQAGLPDEITRIFSNKLIFAVSEFTKNYLSYLSPTFLFTQGAGEATYGMIPGHGVLYLFELPFVVAALWSLARSGFKKGPLLRLILLWILIAPIPAALTKGPGFAANRVAIMMPALQILSAYGAVILWEYIRKKKVWLGIYGIFGLLGIFFFLETYFYHAPRINAPSMSYGWKETVAYINSIQGDYDQIIASRAFSEPQIFIAFYKKWDPVDYQRQTKDWLRYEKEKLLFVDQLGEWKLGKYTFRDIRYNDDSKLQKTLLVGRTRDFPEKVKAEKVVSYPDGRPAHIIVSNEEVK